MAKIKFNEYLKNKEKQEEILFESDEDIIRRARDRKEADPFIVSADYRIENYKQGEKLIAQVEDYPGAEELLQEFREGRKAAASEKKEADLRLARLHLEEACTEDEFNKVRKEAAALNGYKDAKALEEEAARKAEACRKKTTRGRVLRLIVLLLLIGAAAWFFFSGLFSYAVAKAEGMAGIYVSARNRFEKMGDFLDAREQAEYYDQKYLKQRELQEKSSLSDAEPGDTVDFGGFTWIVAGKEDTELTLVLKTISSDGVFGPAAYEAEQKETTWAESSLRQYLNTEALEEFAPAEQAAMIARPYTPCDNPSYGTSGGSASEDLLRIPDIEEAQSFLDDELFSAPGADVWLSSPGHDGGSAAFLTKGGSVMEYGNDVSDKLSILAVTVVDYTKLGQ